MSTDTELRMLPPDQQHAVAEIELQELRKRERLLARASSYPGKRWATLLFLILAFCVLSGVATILTTAGARTVDIVLFLAACALILLNFTLSHVHIHGLNRRLDALLMLRNLETDAADKGNAHSFGHIP